jgi:predicted GIY-YIG superfamily endonuclease
MSNSKVINLSVWSAHKEPGYVYFIQNEFTKNIKIGYAVNVERRLRDLQTGNEFYLSLIKKVPGSYASEQLIHKKFQAYRLEREWFKPGIELQKFLLSLNPQKSIKVQLKFDLQLSLI